MREGRQGTGGMMDSERLDPGLYPPDRLVLAAAAAS